MSAVSSPYISEERSKSNCLLRLQQTYERFQKRPIPPHFKSRIEGPSSEWKIFKRLIQAADFADCSVKDCMIFSYEGSVNDGGQRLFLVTHPVHFWSSYKIRPPHEKCSYEVIRENHPCKLYFDLEFYTAFNPNKDGTSMTRLFIKCVIGAMYEFHSIEIKESDFLWLDASTALKYSCHLVLVAKNVVFGNNFHAGTFVSKLLSALRTRINDQSPAEGIWLSGEEIKNLLVKSKNGNDIWFCDEAVYSKNRNFRLYLSTKPGKSAPLLLSKHNQFISSSFGKDKDEAIFYNSLITYFGNKPIRSLIKYESEDSASNSSSHLPPLTDLSTTRQSFSSCLPSPFSNLDSFILSVIQDNIAVGFVRKWKLVTGEQKIVYDIGNYRFCYNVGRHHKSNNIRITVDMKARVYYQTCLDPECRQFQSEAFQIPKDITFISVPDDFFEDISFTQLPMESSVPKKAAPNSCTDASTSKTTVSPCDNTDVPEYIFEDDDFSEDLDQCLPKRQCSATPSKELSVSSTSFSSEMSESVRTYKTTVAPSRELNISSTPFLYTIFSAPFSLEMPESVTTYKTAENPSSEFNISSTPFSAEMSESVRTYKTAVEAADPDSSALDEEFWNLDSNSCGSLGNVSHEDELLMVDAAEAMEAAMDEDMFSEETMF